MRNINRPLRSLSLLALTLVTAPSCANMMYLSRPKALRGEAPVVWMTRPNVLVRDRCNASTMLINELRAESGSEIVVVRDPEDAGSPRLDITITQIDAAGGGGFSGPKGLRAYGYLEHDGARVGSFTANSSEMPFSGGFFNPSSCGMLEDAVEDLADDLAKWLVRPKLSAELG